MTVSKEYKDVIRDFEGFDATASNRLKDGKWTIGHGNTFYENGTAVKKGDTISRARAEQLFTNILNAFAKRVDSLITKKVTQNQFDALVSLAYNIGIPNFSSSTILKKVNNNPNDSTIKSEFGRWVYSEGRKLNGLVTRRANESNWYSTGTASTGTNVILILTALVISIIIYKYYYGK